LSEDPQARRPIVIIPQGDAADRTAIVLAQQLRSLGFVVELGYSGNMGKRMKRANKLGARAALIIGEDELAAGDVTVRDLDSGEQSRVKLAEAPAAVEIYR